MRRKTRRKNESLIGFWMRNLKSCVVFFSF
jgi:hypothetical protein